MKKFLCVLLSVLMMASTLSVVAFAAEENEDRYVVDDLLLESVLDEESYYHLEYTRANQYFDSARLAYRVFDFTGKGIYKNITGEAEVQVATATLLALVEQVDLEYEDEIFLKILDILGTAQDVADIVEKVNDVIKLLDFVETEEWNTTWQVIAELQKYLQYGDEMYRQYVDSVAKILTCKAGGEYYKELLEHVAAKSRSPYVKLAAADLASRITGSIDRAFADVALMVVNDVAETAVNTFIDEIVNVNTVTKILKKVYDIVGDIAQFIFNTEDQYQYMVALATIVSIEDIMPNYVRDKIDNTGYESGEFAFTSLLKLRTSGETMLNNLETVKRDAIAGSIFNGYHTPEIIERTATQVAKLEVLADILSEEYKYDVVSILATSAPVTVTVYNETADILGSISNTNEDYIYGANGCFASVYDDNFGGYIKVAFIFGENCNTAVFRTSDACYMNLAYETFTKGGFYDVFHYQNKYLNADRFIRADLKKWDAAPSYVIVDNAQGKSYDRVMLTDYDSENEGMIYENDVDTGHVEQEKPNNQGVINGDGLWAVIVNFFNDLFQQIKDFFNNLFK
ncbi:MAG: hypothetical protein IJC45_02905 [Clostridia bacterium]|nr:hypothetical protein [Clostridia bacterium]